MNITFTAGARLCAHEGEVVLPDEDRILFIRGPKRPHLGRTVDVSIHESLWFAPGDSKYIPIRTSEPDLRSMDVWVSRGDRWATLVVFSTKRVPVAALEVNISRRPVQVLSHTKVATLTDRNRLPLWTNLVRPASYQYDEREFLLYENTRSRALRRHYVVHDSGHGNSPDLGLHLTARTLSVQAHAVRVEERLLIYQQLLDNCLWGFVRLPPEEERLVDTEVLEFLEISPEDSGAPVSQGTEPRGGGGLQDQH
ncbi:hypothetical protein PHMEG_00028168 [Phytophthora megakarya]|uniref:Reverse transcriptase n=1 Tax=Phytophthora megakarya TaxID=4795 RepID=A0A225V5M4_9STRA|nr:hypothetical protein PHMEG_00028168 [Phytophthora megakarya]